jgi:hypothetical protein
MAVPCALCHVTPATRTLFRNENIAKNVEKIDNNIICIVDIIIL